MLTVFQFSRITSLAILFAVTSLVLNANAQDVITLKNGEEVQAKVEEVTTTEIKYKKFDNPEGPLFTLPKSGVFRIKYKKGTTDVFNSSNTQTTAPAKRRDRRTVVDDPAAWNYDVINFIENPALTGEDRRHNLMVDLSSDGSEDDSKVAYDFHLNPFNNNSVSLGLGAYFSHRGYNFANNQRRIFGIAGSFKYGFKNNSTLSTGLSLGIVNVLSSGFSDYNFFSAHFGNSSYYPEVEPGWDTTTYATSFVRFGAMNAGAWYHAKKYFAGATVNNITRYNESVYSESTPSPLYFSAAAGYHFNIRDKAVLTPSVVYRTQNFLVHRVDPRLTVSFSKSRVLIGTYYQNKSLYGMFGADLFTHVQFVFAVGGPVSEKGKTDNVYVASSFRFHFTTGKRKTAPQKL